MTRIWTAQTCGDGFCDAPFEFKAFHTLGCQADCGLEFELHPVVVVLRANFFNSFLGAHAAQSLRSMVRWNLCKAEAQRSEAGLADICWYTQNQELENNVVATAIRFDLPKGVSCTYPKP